MAYNWQQNDWPVFKFELQEIDDSLFAFAEETGRIRGMLNAMPDEIQIEAIINTMLAEAIKTSEIEGEYLSRQDVMSSIRKNLGLDANTISIKDKKAQGIGDLMVDVRRSHLEPLTEEKLFEWHRMLMRGSKGINAGAWREHEVPMQVISGALGREKVHFQAPPSAGIPMEMKRFLEWFNDTGPGGRNEIKKAPLRSAIAHLYFETIHPFEDGNGRIGRVIAEKALSQTLGSPVLLSLSRTIEADKKSYYAALEQAQQDNYITAWVKYFVEVILAAQKQANQLLDFTLKKTKYFDYFKGQLNERQTKVIKRMLEAGPDGFTGGMNAAKYISISRTSKATATRDLQHLSEIGALLRHSGGRSTHYLLNLEVN